MKTKYCDRSCAQTVSDKKYIDRSNEDAIVEF